MDSGNVEQEVSKSRGGKPVAWRKDPAILERLALVERRYFERKTNTAIAREAGVNEITVRRDVQRLQELWLERHGMEQDQRRAEILARLEHVESLALAAAAFDEAAERAVLYGQDAAGKDVVIKRDDKGSAQFRGNKSAAIGVARQAIMDQAKVLGLVVDKQAITDGDGNTLTLAALIAVARKVE